LPAGKEKTGGSLKSKKKTAFKWQSLVCIRRGGGNKK
jgi:hypothetical protein